MPVRIPAAKLLILPLLLGSGFAADQVSPIVFKIAPAADSQAVLPSLPPSPVPAAPAFPSRLEAPTLAPRLFTYPVLDSLVMAPREFVFTEYWAQVEKEYGMDDLRMRMGMLKTDSRNPNAIPEDFRGSGLNLLGVGTLLYQAWKTHDDKAALERRFQMRVNGLIDLASQLRLEDRQGAAPGLSLIVAKLDFMGKRVKGALPNRPERRRFTENLKAWAVNPVFDSTAMGPALMEVCRLYEEFEP